MAKRKRGKLDRVIAKLEEELEAKTGAFKSETAVIERTIGVLIKERDDTKERSKIDK